MLQTTSCCGQRIALFVLLVADIQGCSGDVADHVPVAAQFTYSKPEGVFFLRADPKLRLTMMDAEPGSRAVVWPWMPEIHEVFTLSVEGCLRLKTADLCLGAAGSVAHARKIVTRPCAAAAVRECERFDFTRDGNLRFRHHPKMCIGMKGRDVSPGEELIVRPCDYDPDQLFVMEKNGLIQLKSNRVYHFNVKGGSNAGTMPAGAPVVLWPRQTSRHQSFDFKQNGQVQMRYFPGTCLNVDGSAVAGRYVVAWRCSEEDPPPQSELFRHDPELRLLTLLGDASLAVHADSSGVLKEGDGVVLRPLDVKADL